MREALSMSKRYGNEQYTKTTITVLYCSELFTKGVVLKMII
jgi:hypothetical protein